MQADKYISISHLTKYSFQINFHVIEHIISSLKEICPFCLISTDDVWIPNLVLLFLQ